MFRRLGLTKKLLIIVLPIFLLAMVSARIVSNYYQKEEAIQQALRSVHTHADLIKESLVDMMITKEQVDDSFLERLSGISDLRGLHICFVPDSLHLRSFLRSDERTARLSTRAMRVAHEVNYAEPTFGKGVPKWEENNMIVEAVIPFQASQKCQQCHNVPVGYVLGAAHMSISLAYVEEALAKNWTRSIWITLVFTGLVLVGTLLVFNRFLTERIAKLVNATKRFARGELDHHTHGEEDRDEIGELARSFNAMRLELQQYHEEKIRSERLATIGQLASSVIHDFRSPMTAIRLTIEALRDRSSVPREKIEFYYSRILKSIDRVLIMAQELLDYSRGTIKLDLTKCDIREFSKGFREEIEHSIERKDIRLVVDDTAGGIVTIDKTRFSRALLNVVNNAVDAMPDGGTLRFSSERKNHTVTFSISDTGVGIPDELGDRIFEPFVTHGKTKGTGLGLAITKEIVQQHQGRIEFHTERGKGTTFMIHLPLA